MNYIVRSITESGIRVNIIPPAWYIYNKAPIVGKR